MYKVARLPVKDRMDLFRASSQKMGVNEAVIEKDFWVCWTLDYLFHRSEWKENFSFKGGTSLSKAYYLIERFSEDIDLIIDWTLLGYKKSEPWDNRSNSKQDKFNKEVNSKTNIFLTKSLIPTIKTDFSKLLGQEAKISLVDNQNVLFHYPRSFTNNSILQAILLEIGPLAAWVPSEEKILTPYCAYYYPSVFGKPDTSIRTVMAKRTFWEKATILHQEAHRDKDKKLPPRYSRHYYDLSCMAGTVVEKEALADLDLLNEVVAFKKKFYRCQWAQYDNAKPGTFKLSPPIYNLKDLEKDYRSMQSMLFGKKPSFAEILTKVRNLEIKINKT